MTYSSAGASSSGALGTVTLQSDAVIFERAGLRFPVSLACPLFTLEGKVVGGQVPLRVEGSLGAEEPVEVTYAPLVLSDKANLEVKLFLQWSREEQVLRKWASYRLTGEETSLLLEEIVLETINTSQPGAELLPEQAVISPPMSYPFFFKGLWAGIEFPVASSRLEQATVLLAHKPGLRLQPGADYESRRAVFGLAPVGAERSSFQSYILAHSPGANRRFFAWEPWITMPIPYKEEDHLRLLGRIGEHLKGQSGAKLDACVMTAGWSNPQSLWEINQTLFPEGFARVKEATEQMGCQMGLWISPCAFYPFALDTNWAKEQGYETAQLPGSSLRVACLGGAKYQTAFKQQVVALFERYDIAYGYFDGYLAECSEPDHGHEPGALSAETIAEGFLEVIQAIRAVNPDAWLEATCFGGNASPWWLFWVNTVLGNYGDDYCWGRVPAPVYRESYTTARDYSNLQGCTWGLLPIASQEVFAGLYNHTKEPVVNDAVMGLMRGNMLYLLCTNPEMMSEYGWAALAKIVEWGHDHAAQFSHTQPLLPSSWQEGKCPRFSHEAPMPAEPYGYAHWQDGEGLIALRNPWFGLQSYHLKLDASSGLSTDVSGLSAVSLYPENRLYAKSLGFGDELEVSLAPFETVVLRFVKDQTTQNLTPASGSIGNRITVTGVRSHLTRLEYMGESTPLGPDWTRQNTTLAGACKMELEAQLALEAPAGELLVLLEEQGQPVDPVCQLTINGEPVDWSLSGPDTGYSGTVFQRPEQWLYLRAPLTAGRSRVRLELLSRTEAPKVSVWIWAKKPGSLIGSTFPESLPQPEELSLDSVCLLEQVDTASPGLPRLMMERPVEHIKGVFLDSLQPVEAAPTSLNANPGQGQLSLRAHRYNRGLGLVAPWRAIYELDGSYQTFRAMVGVDGGTAHNDKSRLVFTVLVDGQQAWESPQLSRWDNPLPVEVNLAGKSRLELAVTDYAREGTLDHSSWGVWALARMER